MRTWPNTAGGVLSIQQKGALLWPRVWTFWGSFRGNLVTCTQEMRYSHNQAKVYLSTTRVGQAHSSCVGTLFTSSPKAFGLGIGVHKFWGYGPVLRGCPFKQKASTQIRLPSFGLRVPRAGAPIQAECLGTFCLVLAVGGGAQDPPGRSPNKASGTPKAILLRQPLGVDQVEEIS